eukprot:COSAG02_NODE_7370_length_3044_cov_2.459762_4_plen_109_part_01
MPHKVDIRSLEEDSTQEQTRLHSLEAKRRRCDDTAGERKIAAAWRPPPPVLPTETTTCELIVDKLVVGKVSLRRLASSQGYCVQQTPRRLAIHTDRIMSMKGCFSDLAS